MLDIQDLTKSYVVPSGQVAALRRLNLTVSAGEFFVLLGPSGCGKTTLLRCVAGLEQPEDGHIVLDGKTLSRVSDRFFADPEDREVAMVFQSYAVWPHMTVFENVSFPLTEAKTKQYSSSQVTAKVKDCLSLVRLSGLEHHSAATLSGGQQQRVALARALIREPKLLLMDEPLSNLDAKLREEMRDEIKELTKKLGVTTLHVTHDQTEAMALADVIAVMDGGEILEIGHPETLYCQPRNRTVAEFLGRTNWVAGVLKAPGLVSTDIGTVTTLQGTAVPIGGRVTVGIRPEWIQLSTLAENTANAFTGTIEDRTFLGDAVVYWVRINSTRLVVKTTLLDLPSSGAVAIKLPSERCMIFDERSAMIESGTI